MFSYQKKDIDVDTSSSKTTDNKGA
jgi:hypothetical protein